jgi:alpha-tubulin suppressor-like RCC1 family protein
MAPAPATVVGLGLALLASGCLSAPSRDADADAGRGDPDAAAADAAPPTIAAIASGYTSFCATRSDGRAFCWGDNQYGQLGVGLDDTYVSAPAAVLDEDGAPMGDAVAMAPGERQGCALRGTRAWCWGSDAYGGLGDGGTPAHLTPGEVSLFASVAALSSYGMHVCARLADGGLACWGRNDFGQLGDGTDDFTFIPTSAVLTGGGAIDAVAVGRQHTCVATADGRAMCSGYNDLHQTSSAADLELTSFVAIENAGMALAGVVAVAAGVQHSCAATDGGAIFCWGENGYGELGNREALGPGMATAESVQVDLGGPDVGTDADDVVGCTMAELGVGIDFSCGRCDDGRVYCWGVNAAGQLGVGSVVTHTVPTRVVGADTEFLAATDLAVGQYTACALTEAGQVVCWGANANGQLGVGESSTDTPSSSTPRAVAVPLD